MINLKSKNLIILIVSLFVVWMSFGLYNYLFDSSLPTIMISGIDENGCYAGDIQCIINGKDDYKVSNLSVWLDGHPLITKQKIRSKEFEHVIPIETKSMQNGKHVLKIEVVDSAYNKNKSEKEHTFFVDNTPLQVAFIRPEMEHKVFQGRTLHIQFQTNKEIKEAKINLLSKSFECFPESNSSLIYECFVPIDCEIASNEYLFTIEITDKVGNRASLNGKFLVVPYPFKKQVLNVNQEHFKAEQELGLKQDILEDAINDLIKKSPKQKLWHGEFIVPMEMTKITCEFGMRRVSQEKGLYMHKALDISGIPKCVVWAPQDGIIIIKDRYAISGNTVVIDHGCGIFTLLYHLDSFANINVGDKVKRGNPLAKMGKTGYSTGYHLHWEMRINNVAIDPLQWTKLDF